MNIAFDLRAASNLPTSILHVHLRRFICRMAEALSAHSFIIYVDGKTGNEKLPGNVKLADKYISTSRGWLGRVLNKQPEAPGLLLTSFDPLKKTKKGNGLIIEDLSPLLHKEQFERKTSLRFKKQLQKALDGPETIIIFSRHYEQFLVNEYKVASGKLQSWDIRSPLSSSPPSYEAAEQVRATHTGGKAYFLFAGDLHPRHELLLLLKAFSDFKKWQRSGMMLVIAGYENSWTEALKNLLSSYKYRQDVLLLSNPDPALLEQLTAAAYCVVHPALYDPFPFIIHYAMQSKIPVISADIPETRAVGAEGIIYVAMTVMSLSQAMQRIYKDEAWRTEMIVKATAVIQQQPTGEEYGGTLLIQKLINSSII